MYKDHTIGVVIPAYNEEAFIGAVIDSVPDYVDRIYAVDDYSIDSTWAKICQCMTASDDFDHIEFDDRREDSGEVANGSEIAASSIAATVDGGTELSSKPDSNSDRRLVAIRHEQNRGVGGAIKTGYLRALEDEVDVTAVIAGDGQMNPDYLPRILDPIVDGTAVYAKGNRLTNSHYREEMPVFRQFGNLLLTFLTKVASGYWKHLDPQNGYTAISHQALEAIDVELMYEDYGYCNELLARLNAASLPIANVALPAVYGDEESHIRYRTYMPAVSLLLLRTFIWRLITKYVIRDFHPLVLFYATGVAAIVAGLIDSVRSAARRLDADGNDTSEDDAATVFGLRPIMLVGLGWLYTLLAMVFDMRKNEHLETQRYE